MRLIARVLSLLALALIPALASQAKAETQTRHFNPPPSGSSIYDFTWSYSGPIPGQYCVNINEPGDPDAWGDNYLCSTRNYGLRFSFAGPIGGMHCINMNEPEDPHAWGDNYLCSSRNIGLRWSFAGALPGMHCLQISEPAEPWFEAWHDNFLCMRR